MRPFFAAAIGAGLGGALFAGAAFSQGENGARPAGRYAMVSVGARIVRLDTATGAVSYCDRRDRRWYCQPAAEAGGETAAAVRSLSQKVDAQGAQTASLSAEMAQLRLRIEALESVPAQIEAKPEPKPEAKPEAKAETRPDEKPAAKPETAERREPGPAPGLTEQVFRNLFGMVAQLKRGGA